MSPTARRARHKQQPHESTLVKVAQSGVTGKSCDCTHSMNIAWFIHKQQCMQHSSARTCSIALLRVRSRHCKCSLLSAPCGTAHVSSSQSPHSIASTNSQAGSAVAAGHRQNRTNIAAQTVTAPAAHLHKHQRAFTRVSRHLQLRAATIDRRGDQLASLERHKRRLQRRRNSQFFKRKPRRIPVGLPLFQPCEHKRDNMWNDAGARVPLPAQSVRTNCWWTCLAREEFDGSQWV